MKVEIEAEDNRMVLTRDRTSNPDECTQGVSKVIFVEDESSLSVHFHLPGRGALNTHSPASNNTCSTGAPSSDFLGVTISEYTTYRISGHLIFLDIRPLVFSFSRVDWPFNCRTITT